MQRPAILKSGEPARLFPVIAETGKEQRAASIFLSVLSAVPSFADLFLGKIGQRVGSRATVNTFTEVVLNNDDANAKRDRPDGLIHLEVGKRVWTALVETKIGKNPLDADQIERYLRLARENGVDCVLTISNEFAAVPEHVPLKISRTLTRKVGLYHFSWKAILTDAILLHEQSRNSDQEQMFLLREFARFFSHPSAGITGFTAMPRVWADVVERIQAGGSTPKPDANEVVRAWHQEIRDLSLRMCQNVLCEVTTRLTRTHKADAERRLADDSEVLRRYNRLQACLVVPNTAGDLDILADLNGRTLRVGMTVDAPKDKKTNKARLNWLLRQIRDVTDEDTYVGLIWASRAATTVFPLKDLQENPGLADEANAGSELRAFELTMTSRNTRRFMGQRTFIEELENLTPRFYETIGQHISAWTAPPPKPKVSVSSTPETVVPKKPEKAKSPETVSREVQPSAGNAHRELLDIPGFLQRLGVRKTS